MTIEFILIFDNLNVPESNVECESFTAISIDFSLVYENKYCMEVYLDKCGYKAVDRQMIHYLDDHFFFILINFSF